MENWPARWVVLFVILILCNFNVVLSTGDSWKNVKGIQKRPTWNTDSFKKEFVVVKIKGKNQKLLAPRVKIGINDDVRVTENDGVVVTKHVETKKERVVEKEKEKKDRNERIVFCGQPKQIDEAPSYKNRNWLVLNGRLSNGRQGEKETPDPVDSTADMCMQDLWHKARLLGVSQALELLKNRLSPYWVDENNVLESDDIRKQLPRWAIMQLSEQSMTNGHHFLHEYIPCGSRIGEIPLHKFVEEGVKKENIPEVQVRFWVKGKQGGLSYVPTLKNQLDNVVYEMLGNYRLVMCDTTISFLKVEYKAFNMVIYFNIHNYKFGTPFKLSNNFNFLKYVEEVMGKKPS